MYLLVGGHLGFKTIPMTVNAEIEAGVEIYAKAEVQLEASVLGRCTCVHRVDANAMC